MSRSLEHGEEVMHAAHDVHGESFASRIGVTIALLGALLAVAAAKLAGERTDLMRTLVAQQHAHAKYQAQDVKHRAALLALRQLHAAGGGALVGADVLAVADDVERYARESAAARAWVDAFDPLFAIHDRGEAGYERAQLACEVGIVLASLALLLRRRSIFLAALAFAAAALVMSASTYARERGALHHAEDIVDRAEEHYRALRQADKSVALEDALIADVRARYAPRP